MGAVVEESQTSLLAKQNEELSALKNEIQSLQQSGDVREGTVLYNELSALHAKKWKMLDWSHSNQSKVSF